MRFCTILPQTKSFTYTFYKYMQAICPLQDNPYCIFKTPSKSSSLARREMYSRYILKAWYTRVNASNKAGIKVMKHEAMSTVSSQLDSFTG